MYTPFFSIRSYRDLFLTTHVSMSAVRILRPSKTDYYIASLSGYVLICQSFMGMQIMSENIIIPRAIITTLRGLRLPHSTRRFALALIDLSCGSSSSSSLLYLPINNSCEAFALNLSSDYYVPEFLSKFFNSPLTFYFFKDPFLSFYDTELPSSSSSDFSSILWVLFVGSLFGLSWPNSI